MDNIADFIEFLNTRADYHARKAKELESVSQRNSGLHQRTSSKHQSISDWFEEYLNDPPITQKSLKTLFSINPLDLDQLDEDVRSELSVSHSDIHDAEILELLEIAGRSLDLNEIIVGCFRKYKTKHKRTQLTARIHRLVNKNTIKVVGKGKYQLNDQESKETDDEKDYDSYFLENHDLKIKSSE